jgi:hypothetical protein
VRVLVPPLGDWRRLPRGFKVAVVVPAALTSLYTLIAALNWPDADARSGALASGGMFAITLAIVASAAHQRLTRCLWFDITGRTFSLMLLLPGSASSARTRRRDAIGRVGVAPGGGNLVSHVTGQDIVEQSVGASRAGGAGCRSAERGDVPAFAGRRAAASAGRDVATEGLPVGPLRRVLVTASGFLVAAGLLAALVNPGIGFYLIVVAAVPGLGTHEREFSV